MGSHCRIWGKGMTWTDLGLKDSPWATSLVVQWLRLHVPNAGGPGSIPDQGTQSFMLQLRVCVPQLKLPHAATQAQHSQKKKKNHCGYYVGNGLCIEASNYWSNASERQCSLEQSDWSGKGEKGSDSKHILKVQLIEFLHRLDLGWQKSIGIWITSLI